MSEKSYCLKCKDKTFSIDTRIVGTKKGQLMKQSNCEQCKSLKNSFVKKQDGGCSCQDSPKKFSKVSSGDVTSGDISPEVAPEQSGEGLKDIIDRIKAFFKGPRNNYSPSIRSLFEKVADKKIVSMQICRSPIQSAIQKIIDLVSIKETPYDKLFHLYGLMKLEDGAIYRFEKNQVINIAPASSEKDADCMPVDLKNPILFGQFFMKAQEWMGDKYFRYDGFNNNCQDYILACLRANGLLTPSLSTFIKQDVKNLVPSFLEKIGSKVTDLAGAVDTLLHGEGQMGYGLVSTPYGMKQFGFNKY